MGKVRSVEYDNGIVTKYIQESDGKLTINNQQNVNPLMKRNKNLYNHDRGWLSQSKEMKRVASVPPLVFKYGHMNTMEVEIGLPYQKKFKEKL